MYLKFMIIQSKYLKNFSLCSGIWKGTRRQSNFRLRPPSDNFSLHWSRLVSVPRPVFFFTFHSFWTCYAASVPGHMSRNWRKFDQNFNWSPCSDLGSRKIDLPMRHIHGHINTICIFFALALAVIFGWLANGPRSTDDRLVLWLC